MVKLMLAATVAVLGISTATAANAALIFSIDQVGGNVVSSGAGNLNTAGLTDPFNGSPYPQISGSNGIVIVGDTAQVSRYSNAFIGATPSFSNGTQRIANGASGNTFGILAGLRFLYLPTNYISGSALNGTATYSNQTLASLGLIAGSYVYSLNNSDTVTVNVGPVAAAVPEPGTWAMMLLGFGMIGATARYRRRGMKTAYA